MIQPIYVETKTLPPSVLKALTLLGVHRPTIGVYVRETDSAHSVSGSGLRAFTCIVDLDSGASETHWGSWGGSNPFHASPVDADTTPRPLPQNAAVIHGHEGGSRPTIASITIHPSRAAKLLPAVSDVSPRERRLLGVYARLNSRGRKEWFERHESERPTQADLTGLVSRGFIKCNNAGAITITAEGRNHADRDVGY